MRRLNVRYTQIGECIKKSLFGLSRMPRDPELQPGELLLLQLEKHEAELLGKLESRVDFALIFDHLEHDSDGTISRSYWPQAIQTWPYILHCSATIPTVPFSLESLNLSRNYGGQQNARYILPEDEKIILRYIQWNLSEIPEPEKQVVPSPQLAQTFGPERTLKAIYNHDHIVTLRQPIMRTVNVQRFERNQSLADSLKSYYEHHCQVCGQDFRPTYGVPVADTHHIQYLRNGGLDISWNIVVVCPNHHRVIHATDSHFNRLTLTYEYPNGLHERLSLTEHFTNAPDFIRQEPATETEYDS